MKQYRILHSGSCTLNHDILLVEFYYSLDTITIAFLIDLADGEQLLETGSAMQRGVPLIKVMKNDKLVQCFEEIGAQCYSTLVNACCMYIQSCSYCIRQNYCLPVE